jgi:hypothetical protein
MTRIRSNIGAFFREELAALRAVPFWLTLAALALVLFLLTQLPFAYRIDAGYEEGVGSDLPFLQGFNTAEADFNGTYRWTDDGATITIPGLGRRFSGMTLHFIPVGPAVVEQGPQTIDLYAGDELLAVLPVRAAGAAYTLLVPPPPDGVLHLTVRTATFSLGDDPRQLGTPLDVVQVRALRQTALVVPDWRALLTWLAAVAIGWLVIRRALGPGRSAWIGLGIAAGLVALAAWLDLPRWAFGAEAALGAVLVCYPLAVVLRAAMPSFGRRFASDWDPALAPWLTFFVVISVGLRFGGRLYPNSMHGDVAFHVNRFNEAIWGLIAIVSTNRGVDFPYPPGPYLLIAPFTLLGIDPRLLLQLGAALVDGLSALLVFAIGVRVIGARPALLAAAIYVFSAATFMTTWWSFDTHIYTQFLHLLLITTLVYAFDAWVTPDRDHRRYWTLAVGVMLTLVFLGHFGFLLNTGVLLVLVIAGVWIQSWRGQLWARSVRWPLTLAMVGASLFANLFFYTTYIPLFLEQLQVASSGGLSAVAGRAPVSRAMLWETLWRVGLVTHFGFFPIPLALVGAIILLRDARPMDGLRRGVLWMLFGSFAVALIFAVFPFIALVTNSPRWLMFIAWAIALTAAVAIDRLWRSGWIGRAATVGMGALVLANTAWIWIAPMLWRVRPPEPF